MLDSDIYLIPVRLEDCEAPESLASFQLGLPPADYQLTHEATGRALSGDQTLASFGVREGDALRLAVEKPISLWQKVPVWGWVAIGGVVLIAVVGAFLAGRGAKPGPTPAATSVAMPRPTATPAPPTATPLPATTPVPPTPKAMPYEGVEVNILTYSGPQIAEPLQRRGPDFTKLTGAKINVVGVPFSDLYQKIWADLATGTNSFDAFVFAPQWMVDYIVPGYLEDLTDRVAADEAIEW